MQNKGELDDELDYPEFREYRDLKVMLRALGDVVRLNMVQLLANTDEMNVTDLVEMLVIKGRHISQPLVSWHLTKLRRSGLVRTRRRGRLVYCSLDRQRYALCLTKMSELISSASAGSTSPATASGAGASPKLPTAFSGTLQGT